MVPQGFHRKLLQNVAGNQNKQENLALCQNVILTPIDTKNVKNATKKKQLSIHTKVNILYAIPKIDKCFQKIIIIFLTVLDARLGILKSHPRPLASQKKQG